MKKPIRASELLDTQALQLFESLYATRSVTRAAERLGMAQPTVSNQLNRLRRHLKDPLFVRTATGMEPTPAADELIITAREALECLRHFSSWEPSFDPNREKRHFRICMSDASHITLLPQILAHLRVVAPKVRLGVVRIDAHVPRLLESGEADIAIGLIPELGQGFYQQSLFEQDWVCLARRDHPRIKTRLTMKGYLREGHVGIVSGTGHRLLNAAINKLQIDREVVLDLPGFLGLSAVISSTDLLVTLPRHIGETLAHANGLEVFACPFPIEKFTVKQHWHARYHRDAANRWLRGICSELFLGAVPT